MYCDFPGNLYFTLIAGCLTVIGYRGAHGASLDSAGPISVMNERMDVAIPVKYPNTPAHPAERDTDELLMVPGVITLTACALAIAIALALFVHATVKYRRQKRLKEFFREATYLKAEQQISYHER